MQKDIKVRKRCIYVQVNQEIIEEHERDVEYDLTHVYDYSAEGHI
jgi:hypothetical protein